MFSAPLQFGHDLTQTTLAGNLVPATQGRRMTAEAFAIDTPPVANPQMPLAIVRTGPNDTLQYLYTLQNTPLTWLP